MPNYKCTLIHHGIKDQKWGIRRFQNSDGSLTEEGRRRYGKNGETHVDELDSTTRANYIKDVTQIDTINKMNAAADRKPASKAAQNTKDVLNDTKNIIDSTAKVFETGNGKTVRKDYSAISDEELNKRIKRLELEDKYGRLSGDTKYIKSGSEKTREILQTSGAIVGIATAIAGLGVTISNARKPKD